RQLIARQLGATDVLESRGDEGVAAVEELLGGGADSVLECVGTPESMDQAVGSARPGGSIGFVGAPSGTLPTGPLFRQNLHYAGGVAPVRHYLPELLADVLNGSLRPGAVFDTTMTLDQTPDAYAAMGARTAIKVLLRP
ncbi:MAG TPA: zinc-binding dehydrogenase, partial [Friedmanniella sp.]